MTLLLEDLETGRRIAFLLTRAEQRLGMTLPKDFPLEARLNAVLEGAMADPGSVPPNEYRIFYTLSPRARTQHG